MSKVTVVAKSRKGYRCNRCGKEIPAGSKYYRGEINFGPTIIRCEHCKLEGWEVTTSEYQLSAGEVIYRWRENYGVGEDTVSCIYNDIEEIQSEQQDRFDSMPENLQYSPNGELLSERIDACDDAMSELDDIDVEDMQNDAIEEVLKDHDMYDSTIEYDYTQLVNNDDDIASEIAETFAEKLSEAIDSAVSCLEV